MCRAEGLVEICAEMVRPKQVIDRGTDVGLGPTGQAPDCLVQQDAVEAGSA
jgi:hypothetical protein